MASETDAETRLDRIANEQPPYGRLLGVRVASASPEKLVTELEVTPELGNRNGVMHGGAIAGFADNAGGTFSFLHLAEDEWATTLENKTSYFRSIPVGGVVRSESVALHKGRTTMVIQTTILREDGKRAAMMTQTQMIMKKTAAD